MEQLNDGRMASISFVGCGRILNRLSWPRREIEREKALAREIAREPVGKERDSERAQFVPSCCAIQLGNVAQRIASRVASLASRPDCTYSANWMHFALERLLECCRSHQLVPPPKWPVAARSDELYFGTQDARRKTQDASRSRSQWKKDSQLGLSPPISPADNEKPGGSQQRQPRSLSLSIPRSRSRSRPQSRSRRGRPKGSRSRGTGAGKLESRPKLSVCVPISRRTFQGELLRAFPSAGHFSADQRGGVA